MKWRSHQLNDQAVSVVIGSIILLGLAVAALSVIYITVLSDDGPSDSVITEIVGSVEGTNIVLEHRGGEPVSLDTSISIAIGGKTENLIAKNWLSAQALANGVWNIGERIVYPFEYEDSSYITADITAVDPEANAIAFYGTLDLQAVSDVSVFATVNNTTPNIGEPIALTVQVTNPLGLINASGIQLEIDIPEGMQYHDFSTNVGDFNYTTGIWDLSDFDFSSGIIPELRINVTVEEIEGETAKTQMALLFDSSGSVQKSNYDLMKEGMSNAIKNDDVFPHDGSVELTIINFCCRPAPYGASSPDTPAWAQVFAESPIVVTEDNYDDITSDILAMPFFKGWTATACGLNLAANELIDSSNNPLNGGDFARQIVVLLTDGFANIACDGGSTTDTGDGGGGHVNEAKNSAEEARDRLLNVGSFQIGEDEILAMSLGPHADDYSPWMKNHIVWPEPGSYGEPGRFVPGWVRNVSNYNDFQQATEEMFDTVFNSMQVSVEVVASQPADPNPTNNKIQVIITPKD